jgi:hypothetical protein
MRRFLRGEVPPAGLDVDAYNRAAGLEAELAILGDAPAPSSSDSSSTIDPTSARTTTTPQATAASTTSAPMAMPTIHHMTTSD